MIDLVNKWERRENSCAKRQIMMQILHPKGGVQNSSLRSVDFLYRVNMKGVGEVTWQTQLQTGDQDSCHQW